MLGCHREAAAMELGGLRRHQVTATAADEGGRGGPGGGGGVVRPLASATATQSRSTTRGHLRTPRVCT
jgi:hypothetical protein